MGFVIRLQLLLQLPVLQMFSNCWVLCSSLAPSKMYQKSLGFITCFCVHAHILSPCEGPHLWGTLWECLNSCQWRNHGVFVPVFELSGPLVSRVGNPLLGANHASSSVLVTSLSSPYPHPAMLA